MQRRFRKNGRKRKERQKKNGRNGCSSRELSGGGEDPPGCGRRACFKRAPGAGGDILWQSFVSGFSLLLQYLYEVTELLGVPSYGVAIILFTLLVKLVLFPLTVTQMRSMRAVQELQPKVKAIQERYKDKPEKSQEAVMKLYKEAGANPFSGCLPLLVQMPILFALFSALRDFFSPTMHPAYVDLARAGFLWVPNLGSPDLIFLPILTAVATFGQQYATSFTTSGKMDANQKMMLYTMPLFIGYLARTFPAGLALYWVIFSVVGVIEQLIIKRMVVAGREQKLTT